MEIEVEVVTVKIQSTIGIRHQEGNTRSEVAKGQHVSVHGLGVSGKFEVRVMDARPCRDDTGIVRILHS